MNKLIDEFKEIIDVNKVYSHFNFEIVKEEIISSKSNIIFLLGDPGSGKSFLLNYLASKFDEYILFNSAFLSRESIIERLGEIENIKNKKILVDEAQLLGNELLEIFRVISDNSNQVVFAMHKKEGEEIINKPQFKSRYSEKVFLKNLAYDEYERYILSIFLKHNKNFLINKKMIKKIFKITKGNFRLIKKFYYTALILLDYSLRNNLKYKTIDNCIFEMSAIKLGLK